MVTLTFDGYHSAPKQKKKKYIKNMIKIWNFCDIVGAIFIYLRYANYFYGVNTAEKLSQKIEMKKEKINGKTIRKF